MVMRRSAVGVLVGCLAAARAAIDVSLQRVAVSAVDFRARGPERIAAREKRAAFFASMKSEEGKAVSGSLRGAGGTQPLDLLAYETLTTTDMTAFFGVIEVGSGKQPFSVIFDSGSSDVWFPSSGCGASCVGKARFYCKNSTTYISNGTYYTVTYGSGTVEGFWGTDDIVIGGLTVKGQRFAEVTDASGLSSIFPYVAFDGIVGLAFDSLSTDSAPTIMTNLLNQGLITEGVFGFYLAPPEIPSQLTLGGVDTTKFVGNLTWVPLFSATYWAVSIGGAAVQGSDKIFKTAGAAIVDSGTSLLVGPSEDVLPMMDLIGAQYDLGLGLYTVDCNTTLPGIAFVIDSKPYPLQASDFVVQLAPDTCVVGIDMNQGATYWILGDIFMSVYFTAFDVTNKRIGFARAVRP